MKLNIKKNILHALKLTAAAVIAILFAELLHLQFAVSAGIVAILSVSFTKRETIQTAYSRFTAFLFALGIAAICFYSIGFTTYGFFVYLLLFIVLCQFMHWNSAMAMDSVLISHFLTYKEMSVDALANELGLFVIGVGLGIISNLLLRKNSDYMDKLRQDADSLIQLALHRMSLRIVNPDMPDYNGSCFVKLRKSIDEASAMAHLNYMNQISKRDSRDIDYIAMRQKQVEILYDIFKDLKEIDTVPVTAEMLAAFFENTAKNYSMENTVKELLDELAVLNAKMKEMPLPADRKEFEDRARLFAIMCGMEEFLLIKKAYVNA